MFSHFVTNSLLPKPHKVFPKELLAENLSQHGVQCALKILRKLDKLRTKEVTCPKYSCNGLKEIEIHVLINWGKNCICPFS